MIAHAKEQPAAVTPLADALAILDRVTPVNPRDQELSAAIGGVLAQDARTDGILRLAGARLRRIDIALLASRGLDSASIRAPHLLVAHEPDMRTIEPLVDLIAGAIKSEGGTSTVAKLAAGAAFESARKDPNVDAIVSIGAEDGRSTGTLDALARIGRVEFDTVALSPGGEIAFGYIDAMPVILLPGQFNAALAAWLVLGRRLLARLSFRLIEDQPFLLELARPLTSPRGVAEIVPVRRRAAQVEPLIQDAWSPQSIARADGWILVPAETENLPAGSKVQMRLWP